MSDADPEYDGEPAWLQGELRVVVNEEEQYSIWPVDRELPLGWAEAGMRGARAACLEYIEQVWTDMRPLSLRKQMERDSLRQAGARSLEDET